MEEALELKGTPLWIFRKELVDPVLLVFLRFVVSEILELGVHAIDLLLRVVKKRDNTLGINCVSLAKPEEEIAVVEDGASPLIQPQCCSNFLAVERRDLFEISRSEKDNAWHTFVGYSYYKNPVTTRGGR